jgi:hypothetical protein
LGELVADLYIVVVFKRRNVVGVVGEGEGLAGDVEEGGESGDVDDGGSWC